MASRYSYGMTNWRGVFGTSPNHVLELITNWPDAIPFDRPAYRWKNSSFTDEKKLHDAISFFICTGWSAHLFPKFIEGVMPSHEDVNTRGPIRRHHSNYSNLVKALLGGYYYRGMENG